MSDERDPNPQRAPLWPPDPPKDPAQGQPQDSFNDQRGEQPPYAPGEHGFLPAMSPGATPPAAPSSAPQGQPPTDAPQPWPSANPPAYNAPYAPYWPSPAVNPTGGGDDISEARTERISAMPPVASPTTPSMGPAMGPVAGPTPTPDGPRLDTPDLPTQRVPAAPGAEAPIQQPGADPFALPPFTDAAASPTIGSGAGNAEPEAPRPATLAPAFSPPPRLQAAGAPAAPPLARPSHGPAPAAADAKRGSSWRWKALAALIVVVLIAGGLGGLYLYASAQAAAPVRVISQYCAATMRGDYQVAYSLLSSDARAQISQTQYIADAQARDTIQGRVVGCDATPAQALSALSFLRAPRSVLFNARITRGATASGQIALNHDAEGWHVAALSAPLQGIDLDPLHTEQALCQDLAARSYGDAFALLSTPYQHEQGSESTFTHDFGNNVTVTACAPNLKAYSVNATDQSATLDTTLTISVAAGGATSTFPMPARMTLVREAAGWRVDSITPLMSQ